jgi:hypothetical protein
MRRILQGLGWLLAGALLAIAALELGLRLLPVSKGMHRSTAFDQWPLRYTEPHFRYDYSIGWSLGNAHSGVTNNYGHVAPFDFKRSSHPVLVIGDSYIESLMNDYGDSLQGQLGQRIGAREPVYGLGVSGASASGYVGLARLARSEFEPTAAVVLLSDGDLSESVQRSVGTHYLRPHAGSGFDLIYEPIAGIPLSTRIRNLVGDSSLHRYLQINLQFAPENLWKGLGSPQHPTPGPPGTAGSKQAEQVEQQVRIADWFLDELPASLGVPPRCVVLLLDADRYALYKPELASVPKDAPAARAYFIEAARTKGFQVSDLGPIFRERYARDREKFDHYPIDRHWNRRGHGIASDEAFRLLAGATGAAPSPCIERTRSSP